MGTISAIWGILGVTAIIGSAVYRLTPYAIDAFSHPLSWFHWTFVILFTLFMAHAEGYKGFQKKFSPRVVARARYLSQHPTPMRLLLAPLFCMGFFHATKKRLIVSYILTAAIILMIIGVKQLDQPWRGLIDVGVVTGLGWGLVAMYVFVARLLLGKKFDYSPETPDQP